MARALISVFDKTGIVPFAQGLVAQGYEIFSTGGTYEALVQAGVPVVEVSSVTGFPECLDGRVKTLHPAIHAGLLAMRANPEHMATLKEQGIEPIDIVAINLYPFKETIQKEGVALDEAIENIDIGGPTMLRAAAKNWQDVCVLTDPADYEGFLDEMRGAGGVSRATKFKLCNKVFSHTAQYDALIAGYLRAQGGEEELPEHITLTYDKAQGMRYGENPHQSAAFYADPIAKVGSLATATQLQGKELSYNNISDANGALELLREFDGEVAVIAVKHANPCGVGVDDAVYGAWRKAFEADDMSIFGGIVATNATVDGETAKDMAGIFLEIVVAPDYTPEALAAFAKKKNLRVLKLAGCGGPIPTDTLITKSVYGGLLVQSADTDLLAEEPYAVVTQRKPTQEELSNLMLAWKIVKHTKSNGIAIAKDGQSLGIGPGQVNRIWATEQALERSGAKVKGAALGSDAFFPFDDCVKAAAQAGVTAIIQPGGAKGDQASIDACNQHGITMIFTGMRHFKH